MYTNNHQQHLVGREGAFVFIFFTSSNIACLGIQSALVPQNRLSFFFLFDFLSVFLSGAVSIERRRMVVVALRLFFVLYRFSISRIVREFFDSFY